MSFSPDSPRWRSTRRLRLALAAAGLVLAATPQVVNAAWAYTDLAAPFSSFFAARAVRVGVVWLTVLLAPDVIATYAEFLRRALTRSAVRTRALGELHLEMDRAARELEERRRESRRLEAIIENYRTQASAEFRQAATDLLGEESAATVAGHFNEWAWSLAGKHARSRAVAVWLVVLGGLIVSSLLLYGVEQGFNGQLVAAKVSVGLPFGVLYTLFSREAAQYRRDALLAESIAVQMRSVAAYTIWLDQESKDAVRRRLGEAIFIGPPTHLVHDNKQPAADAVPHDVVLQLVQALLGAPVRAAAPPKVT